MKKKVKIGTSKTTREREREGERKCNSNTLASELITKPAPNTFNVMMSRETSKLESPNNTLIR